MTLEPRFSSLQILRYHFKSLDSTQNYARLKIKEVRTNQALLITADQQTAGVTQTQNRLWLSPLGCNIAATFALPFPITHKHLIVNLPQLTALSVAYLLEEHKLYPKIKWINDIHYNAKKMCGILCQNIPPTPEHEQAILIGIGINVNMPSTFFSLADQPITSLLEETGHFWDREALLDQLQTILLLQLTKLLEEGFEPFIAEIEKRLAFINTSIKFRHKQTVIEGVCEGIDVRGGLKIRMPSGELQEYREGHIILPYESKS